MCSYILISPHDQACSAATAINISRRRIIRMLVIMLLVGFHHPSCIYIIYTCKRLHFHISISGIFPLLGLLAFYKTGIGSYDMLKQRRHQLLTMSSENILSFRSYLKFLTLLWFAQVIWWAGDTSIPFNQSFYRQPTPT